MRRSLLSFLFLAACAVATAQTVQWQRGGASDLLELVYTSCVPTTEPSLPTVPGVTFARLGAATSINSLNGVTTRTVTIGYRLRATSTDPFQIPAFRVQTDQGTITVPEFRGTTAPVTAESIAHSVLSTKRDTYWAGEVFELNYTISTQRRLFSQVASDIEWTPAPLITEGWSTPEAEQTVANGEQWTSIVYRTQAYAKTPGRLTLEPARQLLRVQTGSGGFGFGLLPRVEELTVTSNRPALTIRPLPTGAPDTFRGAVGSFKFSSAVVPANVTVGEPVTWTMTLTGTGNWPAIESLPTREVSKDFQAVQPKAKRTPVEGKLFEATLSEDVVLVPTRPGTYKLGSVAFTYFDTIEGKYNTIKTDEAVVTVTDPSGLSLKLPPQGSPVVNPAADVGKTPEPPPMPDAIPRDPLPGAGRALVPLANRGFYILLGAPPVVLLLAWLGLAWRHAVLTDPLRPRRLAARRIAATLDAIRSAGASAEGLPRLLLEWQRASAKLWGVGHAAPPPSAIADTTWTALWEEADRAMYSARSELPADWTQRAGDALAARELKRPSPFKLFLPRNLFPFLAILVAFAWSPDAQGADAAAMYRQGNFAAAEKQWRAALKKDPLDWVGHHNLSLALAQQDRWAESAAHASIAFVQNPRDPSVRWHLDPAIVRGGLAPTPIIAFVKHEWPREVARLASPGEWQLVLALATALGSLAIGLGLMRAYGWTSPWVGRAALACLIVAVLAGAAGVVGLRAYGVTADARAVLAWKSGVLRSIPTEADTTQKTTPLAAGSIAVADGAFLGWLHLKFENGQTGWVRSSDVVGFWK